MKKYLWIFFILILIVGIGIFVFGNKNNQQSNYTAERTGIFNLNSDPGRLKFEDKNEVNKENKNEEETEKKIAEFSTRLPNDTEARDENIKLACKTLNGTVVKKGEIFSLWDVIGCPTKEKGYEKAKTFTSDGEVIKSYGGGICQLSTTIYNAVLEVDGLKITERHEHSREVPYIQDGKDAAVSFGNTDLKFKNTLDYDIKIEAGVENRKVNVKLVRITE